MNDDAAAAPRGQEVIRRTFEAARYPQGSEERARLNADPVTSEYRPGRRYQTIDGRAFRTKKLAQDYVGMQPRCGECGGIRFAPQHLLTREPNHPFTATEQP